MGTSTMTTTVKITGHTKCKVCDSPIILVDQHMTKGKKLIGGQWVHLTLLYHDKGFNPHSATPRSINASI